MRPYFYILLVTSFLTNKTAAQITILNDYFPKSGDSLLVSTASNPVDIGISKQGGAQIWDFRSLEEATKENTYVRKANEGKFYKNFPTATLVEIQGASERYITWSGSKYEEIGLYSQNNTFPALNIIKRYSSSLLLRHAPLNYTDKTIVSASSIANLTYADLPDSLKNQLISLVALTDSFHLKTETVRLDTVDAYGVLKLPYSNYDVLREKRTTFEHKTVEAYLKITKTWVDVRSFLSNNQIPPFLKQFYKKDTLLSYFFFGEKIKEPLVVAEINPKDLEKSARIWYKREKPTSTAQSESASNVLKISIFPNPTSDYLHFESSDFVPNFYYLLIYDTFGTKIEEQKIFLSEKNSFQLSTNLYSNGLYYGIILNNQRVPQGNLQFIISK